jgi:hypothetical protein
MKSVRRSSALFGKTRRTVLALLYSHPDQSFYLRQIARFVEAGQGLGKREHFVSAFVDQPKFFVIGSEHEFDQLARQRMANRTQDGL